MHSWPMVATGCGIPEGDVYKGFLKLWAACWRKRSGYVGLMELECFFGMAGRGERAVEVFRAFGFLEIRADGYWVCGSEKYLRITEARSKGGKAAQNNLKRGKSPGSSRKPAGKQPESSPGSRPALTPNTEHHSPSSKPFPENAANDAAPSAEVPKQKRARKKKAESPTNPRHAPMVIRLEQTFLGVKGLPYGWLGRDFGALSELLGKPGATDDEIDARWRRGLAAPANYREHCDNVFEVETNWNRLAGEARAPPGRVVDLRKAPVRAEDIPKDAFKQTGLMDAKEAFGETN